mmetsp:Transcript_15322/g.39037  ORF Transcript_15322/g.39037 Transcript_15322/m.39037 type:complete len:95 (+) Transcript_15322:2946-3230(+)
MSKRRESTIELSKYLNKKIIVKFAGGREVNGTLRGYDTLLNMVLDDGKELLRDPDDPYRLTSQSRSLGLVVCRGTAVMLVCPYDGYEETENPFA